MKKVCVSLVVAAVVFGVSSESFALPAFNKTFQEKYLGSSADPALKAKVDQAKCNVCHFGAAKKDRNDYGVALSNYLKKDNFKAARLKADPTGVTKEIMDALDKVAAEKNPTGELYGDRIKAGNLPGTVEKK
jgi:hypothetical protein